MSLHHSFDVNLASQYGIPEALLIHHFQHWVMVNKRLKQNLHEDRTWTYQTLKQIAAHFPYFSVKQVERLINKLVTMKILRKGNFNKKKFDQTVWYCFENEDIFMISRFRELEMSDSGVPFPEIGKPIPESKPESKPNPKQGNVFGRVEGVPFSKKKSNTKFPLKKSQQQIFAWLRLQSIDSDDDTLTYYIRSYTEQKIREAIAFMNAEVDKGIKIDSRGKFLRRVLDGTIVMKNSDSEENKQLARAYAELKQWKSLVITEKYLRDEVTGDDLYFNLTPTVFQYALEKLHQKSEIYS